MKRQYEAPREPGNAPPAKEPRTAPGTQVTLKQRRAVPPGYLHDLLHTRHMMKTVGLRAPLAPSHPVRKPGPIAAVTNAGLVPVVRTSQQHQQRMPHINNLHLPSLFEVRKRFLQKKRRRERDQTPYQQHVGKPVGLLSMPEDVMLKIVCYLQHDDVKRMFIVCKQLKNTLREAIRFHFNYATPSRITLQDNTPPTAAHRPDRRKAVTALADVMAHLRQRNQRTIAAAGACHPQGSAHSTGPRILSFTPQGTPMSRLGTPRIARQILTPLPTPLGGLQPPSGMFSLAVNASDPGNGGGASTAAFMTPYE